MDKQLSKERLAEITKEAEEKCPSHVYGPYWREVYLSAAVPRELLLEQEREKVGKMIQEIVGYADKINKHTWETYKEQILLIANQYKSI